MQLVNQDRAAHGRHPLVEVAYLDRIAQTHTEAMARAGKIFHTTDAGFYRICCWISIGENVGMGPQDAPDSPQPQTMEQAFMASAGHKYNILASFFTQIGVGIITKDGVMYVTELFREPSRFVARANPIARARSPPVQAKEEPQTLQMLLRLVALMNTP